MRRILVLILLSLTVCFIGCDQIYVARQGQDTLSDAEKAIAAHKQFIDKVGTQNGKTVFNFFKTTLASDREFLQADITVLPVVLGQAQNHLKIAHDNWREVCTEAGKSVEDRPINDLTDQRLEKLLTEGRREVEAAEQALNKYKRGY